MADRCCELAQGDVVGEGRHEETGFRDPIDHECRLPAAAGVPETHPADARERNLAPEGACGRARLEVKAVGEQLHIADVAGTAGLFRPDDCEHRIHDLGIGISRGLT